MEKPQELQNQHKPVSLQSLRDKVATELGYTRWADCATERPMEFSDKVSRRYAQAVAEEAIRRASQAECSISRAKVEKLSTAAVNAISEISQGNPVGASSFLYKALEETGEL